MDKGRRLTIQQKEKLIRFLVLTPALLILDCVLWLFFGRQELFLLIGCASLLILILAGVHLGIYYGLHLFFERDGRRFTYQVNRNLKVVLWLTFVISVCMAGYFLYTNMPEVNALFCRMTATIPVPEIKLDLHLPDVNFALSDLRLDFWHISATLVCLGVIIISFCSKIWRGIIAVPVMAAYGILFWRACDGNYPQDFAAYIELLKYALIILMVSGILLWDFTGFVWLLTTVRFLVPFTFLCVIAILLQDADPLGSPPINFRAVLFWVLSLVFFAAQSLHLLGFDVPEYDRPEKPDDPVADQSGDEYEESSWW